MLRQPRIWASRASLAQKWQGLRLVLSKKLFKGYIFGFLGDSVARCIFEQFARETNLKKKRSVTFLFTVCHFFIYLTERFVSLGFLHCPRKFLSGHGIGKHIHFALETIFFPPYKLDLPVEIVTGALCNLQRTWQELRKWAIPELISGQFQN